MLNWICTYEAQFENYHNKTGSIKATLIEENPRHALARLRKDDPVWSKFDARLVDSRPVMATRTPWGGIIMEAKVDERVAPPKKCPECGAEVEDKRGQPRYTYCDEHRQKAARLQRARLNAPPYIPRAEIKRAEEAWAIYKRWRRVRDWLRARRGDGVICHG